MNRAWVGVLAVLAAALGIAVAAAPAAADSPSEFVAMGEDRFALAVRMDQGVLVRFARGQFGDDRTAFVLRQGSPRLLYDETSRTLLLQMAYEDSWLVVGFTPEGQELYRVTNPGRDTLDLSLVPGAGHFLFTHSDGVELRSCRTGEVVSELAMTGRAGNLQAAIYMGGDAILTACGESGGRRLIARDLRTDAEIWSQPDTTKGFLNYAVVAYDDQRVFTAPWTLAGTEVVVRARSDGAVLTRRTLAGYGAVITTGPQLPWLVFFAESAGHCGRLTLLDKTTLAEVREVPVPESRYPMGLREARALADGRVLLDGRFSVCRGQGGGGNSPCEQAILYLGLQQPMVRFFPGPLSIAPDGSGWSLGTQRHEVVGEVPWVRAMDLDPYASILSGEVFGGSGQVLRDYHGPERMIHDGAGGARAGGDTVAFHRLLDSSDACFAGTLESVVYLCLGHPDRPTDGVAKTRFRIDERYWGPSGSITVYIDGFDVPDCAVHRAPWRPDAGAFLPGSRHVVVASYDEGIFVVRGAGLFPFMQDELMFSAGDRFAFADPQGKLSACGARIDLESQFARADLVVDGTVAQSRDPVTTLVIVKTYKGAVDCGCIEVEWCREGGRNRSWTFQGRQAEQPFPQSYLLLLHKTESGRYALLEGRWSVLRSHGGTYLRESGLVVEEVPRILGER